MKRLVNYFVIVAFILTFALVGVSHAQIERNSVYINSNCATYVPSPNFGAPAAGTAVCFDSTLQTWTVWNGTVFAQQTCAGQFALSSGAATLTSTNLACLVNVTTSSAVQCTDQTTADALKCAPTAGTVTISGGTTTDKVSVTVNHF